MKKFLSIFFSLIFSVFGIIITDNSYATSNTDSHIVSSKKELTNEEVKNIKSTFNISDKQLAGIQNIVNHPFSIIICTGFWKFGGAVFVSAFSFCNPIVTAVGATIGAVCGGTLVILNLYKNGYESYKKV